MKIGTLSEKCGLSVDTLRYYEKIGLIDPPWRGADKQRAYDDAILPWVSFLQKLKSIGMPLAEIEAYARLRREGEITSKPRRQMLERQREIVLTKIVELQDNLKMLDFKIDNYAEIEARTADFANGKTRKGPLQ